MYGLFVEDDILVSEQLSRHLKPHGYTLDLIHEGKDILPQLKSHKYQFMILDIRLGNCFGLDYVEEIHEQCPDLKVIVISALTEPRIVHRALELGVSDYIRKPYQLDEVRLRLEMVRRQNNVVVEKEEYHIQGIVFDFSNSIIRDEDKKVSLTNVERKILKALVDRNNQMISQTDLIHMVWGTKFRIFDKINCLHVHLNHLRQKFKQLDERKSFITNTPQVGYTLIM